MACDPKLLNRLKRAEGQLRGIQTMMQEGRDCTAIITQLAAVSASIKSIMSVMVATDIQRELGTAMTPELEQVMALIKKL
ncbi:metal-sensitive transcriptional regulator [Lacticaseibacillus kribbianus]|uniref:metal-sensitive transcriptional regulator n=1 Tax=Lacticaseibacillus kribbianus TaxID=2926292 RepID=UPI001CD36208|nr:metal-sensitive transcriptional regulator [Lacticaseibacillus kribbianus]